MKKVLIVQKDETYFLFETLQLLERHWNPESDIEYHLLVDKRAFQEVSSASSPLIKNIYFNFEDIKNIYFDESFNLSNNEETWEYFGEVQSSKSTGPFLKNGQLHVLNLWSTYLLTLKSKTPFLTFHLQDIFQNILDIPPKETEAEKNSRPVERIVYTPFSTDYFKASEQEMFLNEISRAYPRVPIVDYSEIDHIENLSNTLYIGPLSLNACKLVAEGARGFFLQSHFQGFNLCPYGVDMMIVSSKGSHFEAKSLMIILEGKIEINSSFFTPYAIYTSTKDESKSLFLKSFGETDVTYPIYKSHFVLWSFILNLEDISLSLDSINENQKALISENLNTVEKLSKLQNYAVVSTNYILKQAKLKLVDVKKLEENMEVIKAYDQASAQIAQSHSYLRSFLDFYQIRKGQSSSFTLQEQAEESLILYSEEQQVLSALLELFSVTLN